MDNCKGTHNSFKYVKAYLTDRIPTSQSHSAEWFVLVKRCHIDDDLSMEIKTRLHPYKTLCSLCLKSTYISQILALCCRCLQYLGEIHLVWKPAEDLRKYSNFDFSSYLDTRKYWLCLKSTFISLMRALCYRL